MSLILDLLLVTGAIHFGVPLSYFAYLRKRVDEPWQLKLDPDYVLQTTVMIPTFEESALIEGKLENIKAQNFPREKLEVLVIDSGSKDGTLELLNNWAALNQDIEMRVVTEPCRMGKSHALNTGLDEVASEVVVVTEPDSLWTEDSLKTAVSYFSDAHVGAVTGIKRPFARDPQEKTVIESAYRTYYNLVRVAESKIDSTAVFQGEFAAYRTDLLKLIGGFPTNIGADDSYAATTLALHGFRAIAVPDVIVHELTPVSRLGYLEWKKRRALHLIQSFRKLAPKVWKARPSLRRIFFTEFYLHVVNPWLLLVAAITFPISILIEGFSFYHLGILAAIAVALLSTKGRDALRMWFAEQIILVYASLSGLFSSQLIWPKIEELRSDSLHEK